MTSWRFWVTALVLVAACSLPLSPVDDKTDDADADADADADSDDTDSDGDSDTDTDTDTDSDADADADSDTDTDILPTDSDSGTTVTGLDCSADYSGQTPVPGTASGYGVCITEELTCGDVRFHTNVGGTTFYDTQFWTDHQKRGSLQTSDLNGPERSYYVNDTPSAGVRVRVESCMDAWASWILKGDLSDPECTDPLTSPILDHFEQGTYRNQYTDRPNGTTGGSYDYEVIVEGYQGATGNFKISVECN